LQRKTQRKPKRVRDTSLWKFHHTDGREVWGISPMCPDMSSACYSTHDTPGGCVNITIVVASWSEYINSVFDIGLHRLKLLYTFD